MWEVCRVCRDGKLVAVMPPYEFEEIADAVCAHFRLRYPDRCFEVCAVDEALLQVAA